MKLIFTSSNLPAAFLIKVLTPCEWHHVAIAFDDQVIEARFGGVSMTTLGEIKSRGKHCIVDVPLIDEVTARKFALSQVGKGYDWGGVFGFLFSRDWQDNSVWYCSELAGAVAKAGKTPIVREGLKGVSTRDLWVQRQCK